MAKVSAVRPVKEKKHFVRYLPLYLMMVPGIAYIIINNYIPMTGIVVAFKQYNTRLGLYNSPNIGLKNFEFLFRTKDALLITRNTLLYNLAFIVIGTLFAIAVAVLLNEIKIKKAQQVYQTIVLVPLVMASVIVSYLFNAWLDTDTGFGYNSLILVQVWKVFGYNSIIYFSVLVGIDQGYYEAAVIDGANRWKQFLHVTLPGLKPTIITLTLMSIGRIFYSDFGLFYQVPMNSGALMDVTNTIDTFVYRSMMQLNNVGMASAAGVYQSLVGFVLVLTANFVVRKLDSENALF